MGGQIELFARMLSLFAARQDGDMTTLRNAMGSGDWSAARRIAHSLKGNAATLGASELHALATRLETAIRNGAADAEIHRLAEQTDAAYGALADALQRALGET
jgi:HPt (histidine-containing phosphotransfer) domain-containing protein